QMTMISQTAPTPAGGSSAIDLPPSILEPARPMTAEAGGRSGLERVLFPPLRGVRRERLRREADEVRAAIAAGKPVRLVHALELPAWEEGAPPAAPQRRISPAVSDEAKQLTAFESLAVPRPRPQRAVSPAP